MTNKTFLKRASFLIVVLYAALGVAVNAQTAAATPATVRTSAAGRSDTPDPVKDQDNLNGRRHEEAAEEEAAILPYYNNYLKEYHLGPEDVISVEVFGQANYSKGGITIPPTSRISYPLIPGGVFVGGKTVDEVAQEIKQKLDEYIIDPQVMVTLDKAGSARFSVLGKVGTPGVKVMNRRYTLFEAISEAGGIEKDGDKKRVLLVRLGPQGGLSQTVVDLSKVMEGKAESPYLVPGDQIVVPEKRWSLSKIMTIVSQASALRVLFGVPY